MTELPLSRLKIFAINLNVDLERRDRFEHANRDAPLPWSFFNAHTSLEHPLEYSEREAILARGRALTQGELGCFSSHYGVWTKIRDEAIDIALVLEDDVTIDWLFVADLLSCPARMDGIDYLRLFAKRPVPFKIVREPFVGRALIDLRGYAYGTQAYIITKQGATILIEALDRKVVRPVDDHMDRSWEHGLANLAVFPFPAFENMGRSSIGQSRHSVYSPPKELRLMRIKAQAMDRGLRLRQKITGFGLRS